MQKQQLKNKNNKRWAIVVATVVVILMVVADVIMVGNIGYAIKWIECGRRPIIVSSRSTRFGFGAEPVSIVVISNPALLDVKDVPFPLVENKLHCDLDEAKSLISTGVTVQYR